MEVRETAELQDKPLPAPEYLPRDELLSFKVVSLGYETKLENGGLGQRLAIIRCGPFIGICSRFIHPRFC